MKVSDMREPRPRRGAAQRYRQPVPPDSVGPQQPDQIAVPGPALREIPVRTAGVAVGSAPAGDPRVPYVRGLEAQLRTLSQTVTTLQEQLAAYAERNHELEGSHMQLASYRAESERQLAERAAETIRAANAHAQEVVAAAEAQTARIESEARARAMELIEAIGAEIDALERRGDEELGEANPAGKNDAREANGDAAKALKPDHVRGEIGDLLRLRETILFGIRGALQGFERELGQIEQAPLADDASAGSNDPKSAGDDADAVGTADIVATGDTITIEATPVTGVLEASQIEQALASVGGDAHLRSVEEGAAQIQIAGVTADQLGAALPSLFPGASAAWAAPDRVQVRLAKPTSADSDAAPETTESP